MREVRWERMFPDELETAFEKCPVVYLSYGLCEPHGPHNAVGLDALKAHAICCLAAKTYGGIVAPPDYWHIHEIGGYAVWAARRIGERRPWLTAVPPWIHFKNLCYHLRAVDALGFHVAIILTGHYGENWKDLKTLVQILQPSVIGLNPAIRDQVKTGQRIGRRRDCFTLQRWNCARSRVKR